MVVSLGLAFLMAVAVASCGAKGARRAVAAALSEPAGPSTTSTVTKPVGPSMAASHQTEHLATASPCPAGPDTGTIRGKLAFADRTAPASFSGLVSRSRPGWFNHLRDCDNQFKDFRAAGGNAAEFAFEGLPPGIYDLTLLGAEFIDLDLAKFTLEAGAVKDFGTLVVDRGRTLRGRVLGAEGAPASGVRVYAGDDLWGDEKTFIVISREATTGADGSFTVTALGRGAVFVAADDPLGGRSAAVRLPEGNEDLTGALRLSQPGELIGRVTYAGAPGRADITAEPVGFASSVTFTAETDDEGRYHFKRLAAGSYVVTAQRILGEVHTLSSPAKVGRVSIAENRGARLDLAIPVGSLLVIKSQLARGMADVVSVILVKGAFSARTHGDIERASARLDRERARADDTHLAEKAEIELMDVTPGSYTLCGSAIKYRDPRATIAAIPANCVRVRVAAGGKPQTVSLPVIGR